MQNDKPKALGIVIFFERNEEGTFTKTGQTQPMRYLNALDVYANTPNPASQLVGGDTPEEVTAEATLMVENMKNQEYVEIYVDPYL